ncbi:MAG: ATP-dependent metallopeptidase HflB, partial [Agathobacter rectalis]
VAMKLLDENREILDSISNYLYQKETITGKEFMKMFRDMKGLPDPDEEKDGEGSKEQENAQNDETSAADPLLRNATDQPADTNESSEYTAPDDTSNN